MAELNIETKTISQWSEEVVSFSSQYGSESSISYTVANIAGPHTTYPSYGDFTQCCVLRSYGPWWERSPFNSCFRSYHLTPQDFISQDYIELAYEHRVYPKSVDIYETYNPGSVVRILCCDHSPDQTGNIKTAVRWFELWRGPPVKAPAEARIFRPPLKKCPFPTNYIRLEFNQSKCDYYTELDSVLLVGRQVYNHQSSPSSVSVPDAGSSVDRLPLDTTSPQVPLCMCNGPVPGSTGPEPGHKEQASNLSLGKLTQDLQELHLQAGDVSDVLDSSENGYFDLLPEEVIQIIISLLDLRSLCALSMTSHLLYKHCNDPVQYRDLNLQPYWDRITDTSLDGFVSRCSHLRRLSLSWCGSQGRLSAPGLHRFLASCCGELTSLRLACCPIVNNDLLKMIAKQCPHIKDLDLAGCQKIENVGFTALAQLSSLQRVNFYRTMIDVYSLVAVIRSCPDLQHINLGSCIRINDFSPFAAELAAHSKKLRSLDLWRARRFTPEDLVTIAESCPLLEELDLGWCFELSSFSGCFVALARSCHHLKKLFLTANRTICDTDLEALAVNCLDLEQLDILGTREVSVSGTRRILEECKKLYFFDMSFCQGLDNMTVLKLRQHYPKVNIKKSFQT